MKRALGYAGIVSTLAALLAPASVVRAGVCDTLGSAPGYRIIALRQYSTSLSWDRFCPCYENPQTDGSVCASTGRFVAGPDVSGDLVATASSGVAIKDSHPPGGDSGYPYVSGNLVTGGGSIVGTPPTVGGSTDTSGTHPAVGTCSQAMADAAAASAAFAALAPTQVFGDIVVRPEDNAFVIQAHAGDVIKVRSLKMANGQIVRFDTSACNGVSFFRIDTDTNEDDVVVNIDKLSLGDCSEVSIGTVHGIVNVPGSGRGIRIGYLTQTGFPILAPERTVTIIGDGNQDYETTYGTVWAKTLKVKGSVLQDYFVEPRCP